MIHQTNSPEETQAVASKLAQTYKKGGTFALSGPLGAGKTIFIQGFARGLGISERLLSPTFIIIRQHKIPGNPKGKLYHIDLYRLETIEDITSLGLSEIFENPHNIVLIEWAEKLRTLLPQQATKVKISLISPNIRKIQILPTK